MTPHSSHRSGRGTLGGRSQGARSGGRPLIGITTGLHRGKAAHACIRLAVWLAGGEGVKLTTASKRPDRPLDGLIISGGTDIHPSLYKAAEKIGYPYDRDRDALEAHWLKKAEEQGLPVLGICRGAQLINVVRGGDLHMDVSKAYEKAEYPSSLLARIFYRKGMRVEENTLLHRILGGQHYRVNSIHTQAVDRLGRDVCVSAREPNGVIQCIEVQGKPYFLGVQFHPEFLLYRKTFRRIFETLVATAATRMPKKQPQDSLPHREESSV